MNIFHLYLEEKYLQSVFLCDSYFAFVQMGPCSVFTLGLLLKMEINTKECRRQKDLLVTNLEISTSNKWVWPRKCFYNIKIKIGQRGTDCDIPHWEGIHICDIASQARKLSWIGTFNIFWFSVRLRGWGESTFNLVLNTCNILFDYFSNFCIDRHLKIKSLNLD